MPRVKIVATFGPATDSPETVRAALTAGVDTVRLNFSHGDHATHAARCALARETAASLGRPIAIMADLQGPKIRTGTLRNGTLPLAEGDRLTLTADRTADGGGNRVYASYELLARDCRPGHTILLDDGKIRLRVERSEGTDLITTITSGGLLAEHKAINLPGIPVSLPSLTDKDMEDLAFAVTHLAADYIALSFVRKADDILQLKEALKRFGSGAGIIAKIEKPEAVQHIDEILSSLDLGDGIMVARGDLGVEADIQRVPAMQKQLIQAANRHALLCITATQMLESMIVQPMPSRAEATDVFNAVLDGTDAVMLSGETAVGAHPIETVRAMSLLIEEAEKFQTDDGRERIEPTFCDASFELATCRAAGTAAAYAGARAVVALTRSGRTAVLMSKLSLPTGIPFYAVTAEQSTYRRAALFYGVTPVLLDRPTDPGAPLWDMVDEVMLSRQRVKPNDTIVIASGFRNGVGATNVCKIVRLGMREYY